MKVMKKILKFVKKHKLVICAVISLVLFISLIKLISRKSKYKGIQVVDSSLPSPSVINNIEDKVVEDNNVDDKEVQPLPDNSIRNRKVQNNVNIDIFDNKKKNKKKSKSKKCNNKNCHRLQKSHANKCFSCEHELPFNEIYRSQKTKCFSCEQDLKDRNGPKSAFFGQPSKCFDCEAQMKKC